MIKILEIDEVSFLKDPEVARAYLSDMLENGNLQDFIFGLEQVAKAQGITKLAQDTGLGRESLYKTLSGKTNPRFDTILKITRALNLKLCIR